MSSRAVRGFTLIELVVVIIVLSIVAAIAFAKFIDMGRTARLATVNAFTGTLRTTAENVHAACLAVAPCRDQMTSARFGYSFATGQSAYMQYGWLDAGEALHDAETTTGSSPLDSPRPRCQPPRPAFHSTAHPIRPHALRPMPMLRSPAKPQATA